MKIWSKLCIMAWGGSLNKDGSDYIRKIREADKVMAFLEDLKKNLNENQKQAITNTIEIIIDYFNERDKSREDL